ncbi:MAG TPA: SPOR domain-containing protein [Steroidobacter sp.]|nr:SPOR domain-containing protein [Steroidobacter sp.]
MERQVKERLVGAAVLMAAAVILIPEMLSGPERASEQSVSLAPAEQPRGATLKTYTIDLQQSAASAPEAPDERAPPPEHVARPTAALTPPSEALQAKPEPEAPAPAAAVATPSAATAATQPVAATAKASGSREVVEASTQASLESAPASSSAKSTSAGAQTAPSPASGSGWAVQIGSYSRKDTAQRLTAELRAAGHSAFVMPVRTNAGTLHRVRVGPMKDRAAAEAALRSLRSRAPGAAVVTHP